MGANNALLVIDVQKGMDDPKLGERNNPQAEDKIAMILQHARDNKWEVIHVQHQSTSLQSPLHPSKKGCDFKDCVIPLAHEKVIQKTVNSAFIGTDLENYLHDKKIQKVVIVGLTTPHCVSTTVRMSGNLGFETILIEDAVAAFALTDHKGHQFPAEEIHQISLATLNNEFAQILTTKEILLKK